MKKKLDEAKIKRLNKGLNQIKSKHRCRLSKNEKKVFRDVKRYLMKKCQTRSPWNRWKRKTVKRISHFLGFIIKLGFKKFTL